MWLSQMLFRVLISKEIAMDREQRILAKEIPFERVLKIFGDKRLNDSRYILRVAKVL